MNAVDADILTGFNILGFDFKYIADRCEELGINEYKTEKDYTEAVYTTLYNEVV